MTIGNKSFLSGEAWQNHDTWPFKIKFYGFTNNNGDFEGEIYWLNLNAVNKISGKLSNRKLYFKEIEYIKKGNAFLNCEYNLSLLQKNNVITGEYSGGGGGGVEISIYKEKSVNDSDKLVSKSQKQNKNNILEFKDRYDSFFKAIESKATLAGKAWEQNQETWPFIIKFYGFTNEDGDFEGEIHWLSLFSVNKISGNLSDKKLYFKEIKIIKLGNAILNSEYNLPLIQNNSVISGKYSEGGNGGSGGVEISLIK